MNYDVIRLTIIFGAFDFCSDFFCWSQMHAKLYEIRIFISQTFRADVQRETILQNVYLNQPVNTVEISHCNSTPVHKNDDNELQFEKLFSSNLFQRETILQNVYLNQPVNTVEISHCNSTPVHKNDDNELQFEKFFPSNLFHDLVDMDINGYNQSNDMLKSEELHLPFSLTAQSAEDKVNPQNSKLYYILNENSSANATTNTKKCSSEKTLNLQ